VVFQIHQRQKMIRKNPKRMKKKVTNSDSKENQQPRTAIVSNNSPLSQKTSTDNPYYIYCSTCKKACVAKLRVRCKSCKQEVFVVSQEPKSISLPATGKCENPKCTSTQGVFYVKCGEHKTTDESTVLPNIISNQTRTPCQVCGEVQATLVEWSCHHFVCVDCFIGYGNANLDDKSFVFDQKLGYTIGCPMHCPNTLITTPHLFKLMGENQYARYKQFAAEANVASVSSSVVCPFQNCGDQFIVDQNLFKFHKITCPTCKGVFCHKCQLSWHEGPCQNNKNNKTDNKTEQTKEQKDYLLTIQLIESTTEPCPNSKCKVKITKEGGCNHVTCNVCKFEFCWHCLTPWSAQCRRAHWFGPASHRKSN